MEFRSKYEELLTLKEQLEARNSEFARLLDDLNNVLNAVETPIVILGSDLRVRFFTPAAETLLGLSRNDAGRQIGELPIASGQAGFEELIVNVLEKGVELRREVQAPSGHWFLLRARPWRVGEGATGALLGFVEIDELRRQREALQKDASFLSAILETARDLLVLVLDRDGAIVNCNQAWRTLMGYSLDEVRGRQIWDLLAVPGEAASLKAAFDDILQGTSNHWACYCLAKDGERRLISWWSSLGDRDGGATTVIATGTDVTAREEAIHRAQQSEATVRALLESAPQAILACDREGSIVFANAVAAEMFGYGRDALPGRSIETLIAPPLRRKHAALRASWFAQPKSGLLGVGRRLTGIRGNGAAFPIEVSLSSVEGEWGPLAVAFISDITAREQNERARLRYKSQLQKLTGALLSAQENANRALARNLHDVFSQELAAIGMEISHWRQNLKGESENAQRLNEIGARIGRLSADLHGAARDLHPAILEELGLEAALQQECETFQSSHGITTLFTAFNVPAGIPKDVSLCLFRVAQECLRNVQKHSASPNVRVRLEGKDDALSLRIEDSGDGFDLESALKKGGLGLISMEERVRMVNGKLSIQSQPGKGAVVTAVIPIKRETA